MSRRLPRDQGRCKLCGRPYKLNNKSHVGGPDCRVRQWEAQMRARRLVQLTDAQAEVLREALVETARGPVARSWANNPTGTTDAWFGPRWAKRLAAVRNRHQLTHRGALEALEIAAGHPDWVRRLDQLYDIDRDAWLAEVVFTVRKFDALCPRL